MRCETEITDILLPQIDCEHVADEIGDFVIETVLGAKATGCVIGLSGGVDSTTSAALIKRAFDRYNSREPTQELELVGYILPSGTNRTMDSEDGVKVAQRLGIRYEVQDIEPIVAAHASTNPEALADRFHRGNLSSRVRANVLNTKAATERKLVAGTGNRDEDYGIGYYTLFGDGAVHLSPIGNLSKRLVKEMATYLGFPEFAHREPTAGLEPGQTDFKDLGYRYDTVEIVMAALDRGIAPTEVASHRQVVPFLDRDLADHAKEFGGKFAEAYGIVEDIIDRHKIAGAKAKLVSPGIAPISAVYR